MTNLIEKYFYGNCKGTDSTDYCRQQSNSVADVYTLLKDGFKDILQELMEAELDVSLGYEKTRRATWKPPTNGTGIPKNNQEPVWGTAGGRPPGQEWGI